MEFAITLLGLLEAVTVCNGGGYLLKRFLIIIYFKRGLILVYSFTVSILHLQECVVVDGLLVASSRLCPAGSYVVSALHFRVAYAARDRYIYAKYCYSKCIIGDFGSNPYVLPQGVV